MSASKSSLTALTLGAIGVVYGDIGTSVLYAVKEVFGSGHVPFTPDNVYGILSIFFWTLTVIVSLKYVLLVLRADNNGEGGLVAMLALASQSVKDKPQLRRVLLVVGIFGTCLFYGDGVITPAISVLSEVEGLEVVSPAFKRYVIPLTLIILFCLFAVQKRGTSGIGKFFGPITLVWFACIALLGLVHIQSNPAILWAISPHYALGFMWHNPGITFIILGAVVLCVTGGAARSHALRVMLASVLKAPVRTVQREEAGAAGAAMMAAVQQKLYPDMDACVAEWVTPLLGSSTEPDPSLTGRYDGAFGIYKQTRETMRPLWREMVANRAS